MTDHALISLTETMKFSLDKNRFGCGISLDLQKPFDTVNHDILLKKLEHYGIRGIALNWFQSYLNNRKQLMSINGHSSSLCNMSCGVRQGSFLGPLLFRMYMNDLPNSSNYYLFSSLLITLTYSVSLVTLTNLQSRSTEDLRKLRCGLTQTSFYLI